MHYLTLLKIYNNLKNKKDRNIIKKIDTYINKLSEYQKEKIYPSDIAKKYSFNNDQVQRLIYIFRLASELKMFKKSYDVFYKNEFIKEAKNKDKSEYIEYCEQRESEYTVQPDDFIVGYELLEEPFIASLWNKLFRKSA